MFSDSKNALTYLTHIVCTCSVSTLGWAREARAGDQEQETRIKRRWLPPARGQTATFYDSAERSLSKRCLKTAGPPVSIGVWVSPSCAGYTALKICVGFSFPTITKVSSLCSHTCRVPKKLGPGRTTPSHIIIKLPKINNKERILKAAREEDAVTYKGVPIRLSMISQKKSCRQEGAGKKYSKS